MQGKINFTIFEDLKTPIFKVNNLIKLLITIISVMLTFILPVEYSVVFLVFLIIIYSLLGMKLKPILIVLFTILLFSSFFGLYSILLISTPQYTINILGFNLWLDPFITILSLFYRTSRIVIPILLYSFSSSLTQIEYGLDAFFSPLYYIKFPVGVIVLTVTLALGFLPVIFREVERIMLIQAVRGNDFTIQNFKGKIRTIIFMLIPLLISSIVKAEQLSYSIESRNFDPFQKRTHLVIAEITKKEKIVSAILILIIISLIFYNIMR